MNQIKQDLLARLEGRGIDRALLPGFIRCLANSLYFSPQMDIRQINERLRYLGWKDVQLDYHTLQMAIKCFEEEGVSGLKYRPGSWYKSTFSH